MNTRSRNQMAARRSAERKRPERIISMLLILSLLCGNLAGFPSSAAELISYCGKEEHTHSEECYKIVVTSDPAETEGETNPETTGETTAVETTAAAEEETTSESTEAAVETTAAQTEVILSENPVCGKEGHTHELKCYSNPSADVETTTDWEATLPETLSGDWAKDLLATVKSQVGYAESDENYIVEEDGETISGYNRYGAWYSSYTQDENQPYLPWNITFLFFSIYYSNIDDFPLEETCEEWIDSLDYYELYRAAGEYTPNPGDMVFADTDGDGEADRAGVVSEVKDGEIIAIEGDYQGAVAEVAYDLPELTVEPETTESTETTETEDSGEINVSSSQNTPMLLSDGETEEDPEPQVLGFADMAQAQADAQPENSDISDLNGTSVTIYFACWQDWSNYTVKLNVQQGSNEWQQTDMSPTGQTYTYGVNTYNVYSATVTEKYGGFDQIYFQKYNGSNKDYEYCAASSWVTKEYLEGKIYVPYENVWVTYSSGGGGGTTGTVVDIKTETFEPVDDVLYVDSTFYDYYTDYELNGNNRDSNTTGFSVSNDTWVTFRNFNTALSNYYSSNSVKIPIYVGHFQPDWDGWGYPFSGANLSLYGYKDGNAYGTTSTDQRYFMSVNNSHMDSASTITSGLTYYAAQGLVSSTLVNDSLMSVNKNGGTVVQPFFSASFLTGGSTKLGDVYETVSFPFIKEDVDSNGVEYWIFDSEKTTVEMKQDSATGDYFLEDVGNQSWSRNLDSASVDQGKYGFFPFNSGSTASNANTYNYGFGCRLDIPFRLTEDGYVLDKNGNKVAIEFEFSGDDDVWVFIDGKLALDIGGSHGKVTGSLNFATKKAYVSNAKINPGTNNTGTNGSKTTDFTISGDNQDEHTLTMFYMERGMWESNMRITFNFPDENQLEVEKEVDTTAVNSLFTSAFQNQKMFTFNIKNLATHFADVAAKGATYDPISWDIAKSTLSKNSSNTFSRGTYQGVSNALHWYAQYDDTDSAYRHKRYGVLTLPSTIDITNMTKLSFYIYVEDGNGFNLSDMYLQILDSGVSTSDLYDNSLTAGNSDAMGCIGTSLSGKTYGSVSTAGNTWVKVTLDLSKLDVGTSFDKTSVKYLRFGYNYARNIYLHSITFEPAAQASNPTGFITQQYDVPSYGSATSGKLENATGAVYTSNKGSTASYVVDANGQFALEDGEVVNFHDQFRRGSYIYLEEVLSAKEQALYDTTWTMYEDDKAVSSFGTGNTVTNPSTIPDMTDVASEVVTDGRVEYYQTTDSSGKEPENAYKGGTNPGGFVFRSYANPDSTATTTKLRVKFTNTVNTANLTISKVDMGAGQSNAIGSSKTFTFVIEFYNVGGLGLESSTITHVVTLTAGSSTTITGIPVNTQYTIYELKTDDDIVLNGVSGSNSVFTPTTYSGKVGDTTYTDQDAYMVSGSIGTTNKSVTFTNVKKPTFSLKATKEWLDADGTALADTPDTIYLRLYRRAVGSEDWLLYVNNGFTGYQNVEFTPGYGAWEYTFAPLDVYKDYPSTSTKWEYKVVELDALNGNVIAEGDTITIEDNDYTVTYDPDVVTGTATNSVETQKITNTLKPAKVQFTVTKTWVAGNDASAYTGTDIPASIWVQVQRKTSSSDSAWTAVGDNYELKASDNWTHTFTDLDARDENGAEYEYKVVELKVDGSESTEIAAGKTITYGTTEFAVTYGAVTEETEGQFAQNIQNRVMYTVTLDITKLAKDTGNALDGVTFKLEKVDYSYSTVDSSFTARTFTTGSDGKATFSGLGYGYYLLTETKTHSGYNLLSEPIQIEVRSTQNGSYEVYVNGTKQDTTTENSVITYSLTIYNKPSLTMPATGGVNGFEFWILGGLCMMAVPLLLYTFFWFKKGGKYLRK